MKRCCDNCFHGHYNLSERGEEIYCTENGYSKELVTPEYVCESHEYIQGYEEGVEYNGCADSETIARYLDKYEYEPNKVEEVLKRFEGISKKESTSKVLKKQK